MKRRTALAVMVLAMAAAPTVQAQEYSAAAQGFGGEVTVTLTIDGDTLTDVVVTGEQETAGVGSNAVEQMPGRMLEANSVEVDGVSGASVTSGAILTAAAEALSQSGATLAEVQQDAAVYEDCETEVVVVGGGVAGMSAAMVLADAGVDVILLEKADVLGGAATLSHSAIWAIGNEMTVDQYDFTADEIYEFFEKQAGPVYSKEVFYRLANESYDSLHFLMDNGVVYDDIAQCNPQADPRFWYSTSENYGVGMMQKLTESYNTRDIDTRMATTAKHLVLVEDGSVCGVVAECDGSEYTISAQKVILATGGIGRNEEMMREYEPNYDNIITNQTVSGATGDGHNMGVEAGGYLVGEGSMGASGCGLDPVEFGTSLMVNIEGEKVGAANDHYTHTYVLVNESSNGQVYSIYPSDIADYSKGGTLEGLEELYQNGGLYKADTVEELADQMGIDKDTLLETIAVHNAHCEAGESDEFNTPEDRMVPIVNGPFYGATYTSGMIGTVTGLAVNEDMEVIKESGEPIGNLYAAGEMVYGNWFNGNYPMSGTGLGGCVSGGRIAAQEIIEAMG